MARKKLDELSKGGVYFKNANYTTTTLLIVEPKSWYHDANNTFNGNPTPRDVAVADITVFRNADELKDGNPSEVLKGAQITGAALVNVAKEAIGEVFFAGKVDKVQGKSGAPYWSWIDVTSLAHEEQGDAYLEAREAEVQAAVDDAPDFD